MLISIDCKDKLHFLDWSNQNIVNGLFYEMDKDNRFATTWKIQTFTRKIKLWVVHVSYIVINFFPLGIDRQKWVIFQAFHVLYDLQSICSFKCFVFVIMETSEFWPPVTCCLRKNVMHDPNRILQIHWDRNKQQKQNNSQHTDSRCCGEHLLNSLTCTKALGHAVTKLQNIAAPCLTTFLGWSASVFEH